ncbi:helix-turn-helix domain-containing protein [Heyndrickxia acidicola]|uniref:Helix-turn-helix transcriptional regulator n=1 Tax=Heyndrickxia acidicola TaxID=209389 RepID=A0ABU6MMG8_9BACI|nr:helix-turn-helix transcriptional regulator [Heyndrickxia acidicola]MED1205887.1 helix-turn-helix transcriptional regulator [Heyndrickxia acidicola]
MKIKLKDPIFFNELLIKKGFSKNSFSKAANLGQPTIVQISNGTRCPGPVAAKKIVDTLQVEFEDIFEIER